MKIIENERKALWMKFIVVHYGEMLLKTSVQRIIKMNEYKDSLEK